MVVCKNCRKEIDKKASICPHCGVKIHPIKDTFKIVIIVIGVIIGLCLLVAIFINAFVFSGERKQEKENNKLIGTWKLQTNNEYEFEDVKLVFDKTMNIKSVDNCTGEDTNCISHGYFPVDGKEVKMLEKLTIMENKDSKFKNNTTICYSLVNDDTLKQSPCPGNMSSRIAKQEMNITYKKVK